MSTQIAALRRRLPDLSTPLGRAWDRLPPWGRWAVYMLLLVVAVLAPNEAVGEFMTPDSDWNTVLFYPIGIYVLLAIGLNIVVGQAGLLDLGYVAFFAIGGYTMGILASLHHETLERVLPIPVNFWTIVPVAALVTAGAGLLLGSPTLRLRGDYLAIVTLGFGEIIRITAQNTHAIGGPTGISDIPHPPNLGTVLEFGILDLRPYWYLLLTFIVLAIILHRRLEDSRVGRAWMAIREDEDAAELSGVPTFKFKLWAFALGGVVGGTAGVIYASQVISITPRNYPFILSALILCAVVLGGSGNIVGVIIGAFLIAWLPERFREFANWRVMVFGAALVLMMIIRPEGLVPSRRRRAELAEGEGGMGALGGEVADVTRAVEPVGAPAAGGGELPPAGPGPGGDQGQRGAGGGPGVSDRGPGGGPQAGGEA